MGHTRITDNYGASSPTPLIYAQRVVCKGVIVVHIGTSTCWLLVMVITRIVPQGIFVNKERVLFQEKDCRALSHVPSAVRFSKNAGTDQGHTQPLKANRIVDARTGTPKHPSSGGTFFVTAQANVTMHAPRCCAMY